MKNRVCIVTGGNAGIGKETVRGLAGRGATVVMACRNLERGEAARREIAAATGRTDIDLLRLDLGSRRSIEEFASEFEARYPALHVLVNNAGVMSFKRETTADGLEATFGTNHIGPFLLTLRLLGRLKASAPARIVNVSSGAHEDGRLDFDDLQSERDFKGFRVYSSSKLANVLFTRELARRLEGSGVTANALHPGVIATALFPVPAFVRWLMRPFTITEAQGAQTSIYLSSAPEVADVSGRYFVKRREAPVSPEGRDDAVARRLWEVSLQLAGLTEDPLPTSDRV